MEVFVGVFDNDENNKLGLLKDEENDITNIVQDLEWKFIVRGNMGGKSLPDLLGKVSEEMTIFHFSGHHGHGLLNVVDGKVNAKPLIDFLNTCQNLKLVFINGCESQNFVDGLSQVPFVIGTSKKIIDSYAFDSSVKFYQAIKDNPDKFKTAEGINELFARARQLKDMSTEESEKWENTTRGGDDDDDDTGSVKDVYVFQENKDAANFDVRVSLNMNPEEKDVNKDFFELTQPLEESLNIDEIEEGELYKAYPYIFSWHLEKLKPELEREAGFVSAKKIENLTEDYSKLSSKRSLGIVGLHSHLITFLKYCGCSILWTLHRNKSGDIQKFSPDQKETLKFNLSYDYMGTAIGSDKIEELVKLYEMIPDDSIAKNSMWINLKNLITSEKEYLKQIADLFHSFKDREERNKVTNWIKAEEFLIDFVTKDSFSFLRSLSIWSVYDIYFRQFRFRDDKELAFTKGHFPIATRPVASKSEPTTILVKADTKIDYDIQSVYLMEGEERILNLTPFYVDMNASDENANKMQICYLEKYPKSQADVILKFISLRDEEKHSVTESDEEGDQKKIFEQVKYFWSLISDDA